MKNPGFAGHCEPCGKQVWESRRTARQAAKRIHPGEQLHAYACPAGRGYHYGHTPEAIRRGRITRDVAFPTTEERTA